MKSIKYLLGIMLIFFIVVFLISCSSSSDSGGGGDNSVVPTGVTATSGNSQAIIAWNAVSGATSYNIYWSTTSGVTPINGNKITGATNPYTQTGLTNKTTYYYVVSAVNGNVESMASAQVSAIPREIWTLEAQGISTGCTDHTPCQSDPPYKCGTAICGSFEMGDSNIQINRSGNEFSVSQVDFNSHPFTLVGSINDNAVTFTIQGTGITPGVGPATTTYTGTQNGNVITGNFTGSASWTYDQGGIPITETAKWNGTFTVTVN